MPATPSHADELLAVIARARVAALDLDNDALAAATADLERLAAPTAMTRDTGTRVRAELARFMQTCRFLSQTLVDCLDAALSGAAGGETRRYERGGKLPELSARPVVVTRYG